MSAYAGLRNIIIIGILYGFHGLINRSLLIDGVNEIFLVTARISLVCVILGLYCIRDFINDSFENNYAIIKVITGKGYRSKAKENPYISSELSVLKNSIPEFIRNEENLYNKIDKIYSAKTNEGGEGAFYIELKDIKE